MKKSMFLLFAVVLIMGSCKKDVFVEKPEEETKAQGISEKDGVIQFSTFEVYRQFLENPDESKQLAVIKAATQKSGFKSLKSVCMEKSDPSAPTANTVGNLPLDIEDYGIIAELLNSEGIAQIGDYLFIIDFTNEKCYALHSQWQGDRAKYSDFINGVTNNNYVFEFSFDEQAIEILSNIGSPAIKANGFNAGETEFAFFGDSKVPNIADKGDEIPKSSPTAYLVKLHI
jgi:hypothetical protein